MADSSTRERMIRAAVDLFSVRGYDGTSVDEIASAVGIKGPNLYKYFKGKEALFQEIASLADEEYNRGMSLEMGEAEKIHSGDGLKEYSMRQIAFTLNNENIIKMRRILTMEQYRNEMFAAMATKHQIATLQSLFTRVFRNMMAQGSMKPGDPALLALEFIAPASLLIQMCDREPEKKDEIMKTVGKHIDHFIEEYCGANG